MWRSISLHEKNETEFLDAAMERITFHARLRDQADAVIEGVRAQEPLLAEAFRTPQSAHFHAEGPFLEDHIRLMLMVLYAVAQGDLHLIDIEEFRRLKGYEGEIDELEEMMKENISTLEVFCLCHDAGKWATVGFQSLPSSRGYALGFHQKRDDAWDLFQVSERAKMRTRYLELYEQFAAQHPLEPDAEIQAQFFLAYGIDIHYFGHDRVIHTPVYERLLARVGAAHRLEAKDVALLEDVIAHHLAPVHDFQNVRPNAIGTYLRIAEDRGYDQDDFIDLMQACLFLDVVCGSVRRSAHGLWHDPSVLIHFFQSEHLFQPSRRVLKEERKQAEQKREQNRIFQLVGLDGVALLDLLQMEPGPKFGQALRRVQAAVLGKGDMPHFSKDVDEKIRERAMAFYKTYFEKGD